MIIIIIVWHYHSLFCFIALLFNSYILEGNTYVSCDWELDIKEKYYDVRKAEV